MSLTREEIDHAVGLFADLGNVTSRRMFGGLGIYRDGTIFAILMSDGQMRLKGAGDFIAELEAAGCEQWVYTRDSSKGGAMPYWTMPEGAVDDPELACDWARRALAHL